MKKSTMLLLFSAATASGIGLFIDNWIGAAFFGLSAVLAVAALAITLKGRKKNG